MVSEKMLEMVRKGRKEKPKKVFEYDFTKPQKQMGVFRKGVCPNKECKVCFEYLYLKSFRCEQIEVGTNKVYAVSIPARIVCSHECEECGKNLTKYLREKESGAMILK